MKLLKKIFCWAIVLLSLFVMQNVKALDISDYEFEVVTDRLGAVGSSVKINIRGSFEDDTNYYVKFVNEGDPKPTDFPENWYSEVDDSETDITKWKMILGISSQQAYIYTKNDWFMLKGYDYAYLLKCNKESCEISETPIKLTRAELPSVSKRYQYYIFKDPNRLSVFPLFPYEGEIGSHKMNVKIGIINDNKLLYSIYKNESGAMENLLNYAKNHNGYNYSFLDDEKFEFQFNGLEIVNGAYYYIYTDYENTDGLYRDLSDVTIAMAEANHIVNEIKWNFGESTGDTPVTTTQVKVQNPKTGDLNISVIIVSFIVCVGLIIISKKKLRKN